MLKLISIFWNDAHMWVESYNTRIQYLIPHHERETSLAIP